MTFATGNDEIDARQVDAALADRSQHAVAIRGGALCWRCPLYGCRQGPVPSTIPDGATFAVVAEAPGLTEVQEGATLIGASGREVRGALAKAGMNPNAVAYVNALQCRPENGDLKRYLQQIKPRLKSGELISPIEACRPRLRRELSGIKFAVLMGSASLAGVGLHDAKVMKYRGTPVQIPDGPTAIPTPHAAYVLRDDGARFRPVFAADVAKAVRIAHYGSTWRDPWYFVPKTTAEVENFLSSRNGFQAVDCETDGKDSWTCNIRRVGIGTSKEVMIYSPLSVHGQWMLPAHEIEAQTRAISAYFNRSPSLGFHNFYGFDSVVLHRHKMPVPDASVFCTLIGHRIGVTSELPHRLDFLGSIYTDAPYWKDDVKHSNVRDDETLNKYLSYDVAVTHDSAPFVHQNLVQFQQQHIYGTDVEMSQVGRSMSALGIWINPRKRYEFAAEYQKKENELIAEFNRVASEARGRTTNLNPGSYPQVRTLLYEDLKLPLLEEHVTDAGEPSTDENTLIDLLGLGIADKRAERVIHAIIGYREADKILGTYTGRINDRGEIEGGPPVHADGRLRTGWNPGKVTGRWGSSDPVNLTNVPKKLREMYQPRAGYVYVGADMSALELRILALLSNDEPMLAAFKAFDAGTGLDVHTLNACDAFGCTKEQVTDDVRTFTKRTIFGRAYGAQAAKIYQTLSLMRDDDLKPIFPTITLQEVERFLLRWDKAHPAVGEWQKKIIYGRRSTGYVASPWHKRKRFFIGGENFQEEVNFPIQSGAADLQNGSVSALVRQYPFDFARGCGLVLQVHDQLVIECPEGEAERVKVILEGVMTRRIDGLLFPAAGKIGTDWKKVS